MAKRSLLWWLLALLAVGGSGFWYVTHGQAKPQSYVTAPVQRGSIEDSVSALGNLQPLEFVDVGTQVTGQLKRLRVNLGDAVRAGELLAEIDPTLFETRVESSRANLASLRAQLAEKVALARLAGQLHERNQALFKGDAVSEEVLQASAASDDQARAQVASLQAQIEQAESQLRADEANLRYTKIYAPIDGTVVSLTARQGQTLVSSQQAPTILRIANLDTMTVWAQVSEADVPKIRLGMPASFTTLGESERHWRGTVRQILPTPEVVNNVVLYDVLFDVTNPDEALKPQMSAQVAFRVAGAKNALLVPAAALQAAADPAAEDGRDAAPAGYWVQVLKAGHVEQRTVKVGLRTRLKAQVLAGLAEGEAVVVAAAEPQDAEQPGRTAPRPARLF